MKRTLFLPYMFPLIDEACHRIHDCVGDLRVSGKLLLEAVLEHEVILAQRRCQTQLNPDATTVCARLGFTLRNNPISFRPSLTAAAIPHVAEPCFVKSDRPHLPTWTRGTGHGRILGSRNCRVDSNVNSEKGEACCDHC